MINQVSPGASKETFYHIAREIFSDGNYNWGRIVALFYFGYKMVLKVRGLIWNLTLLLVLFSFQCEFCKNFDSFITFVFRRLKILSIQCLLYAELLSGS
jgi:hypothetical protein